MRLAGTVLGLLLVAGTASGMVTDGLILHFDAAGQIGEGGVGSSNSIWKNLAGQPDSIAGSGVLHNFAFDSSSGWVGAGVPSDPYALRFDGKRTYVLGPGNLEIPEVTIEAWARVDGIGGLSMRAATLIGNDFGMGGISLMMAPTSESVLLLYGITFNPTDAEFRVHQWGQVAVTWKAGAAQVFVNGVLATTVPAPRQLQSGHHPFYQLGAARRAENDFAESDALIGSIAIVRVYNRALSPDEIKSNFDADKGRFDLKQSAADLTPISSMPIPKVAGLGLTPPARCVKWDYVNHPARVTGTGTPGWPYAPRWAFDGYPAKPSQPYVRNYWRVDAPPTPEKPAELVIDYRGPVAVTRFAHYFQRSPQFCAWKQVDVLASDDRQNWTLRQSFADLPECGPQVLSIDKPAPARFYKIVIRALADGATRIETREIETYYGATIGAITVSPTDSPDWIKVNVRVVSPDAPLKGAKVRMVSENLGIKDIEAPLPTISKAGGSAQAALEFLSCGAPVFIELRAGGCLIDRRTFVLPERKGKTVPVERALRSTGSKLSVRTSSTQWDWSFQQDSVRFSAKTRGAAKPVTGTLRMLSAGKPCPIVLVGTPSRPHCLAARVPGGLLRASLSDGGKGGEDLSLRCSVEPDDANSRGPLDFEFRLAVDSPEVMFRPHIDWYTVEHGPNWPHLANGHNSATRMLCIQTDAATISMVPDTDNLVWGFNEKNEMVARFHCVQPRDMCWTPIDESPWMFELKLPVRKGDWWDAYQHVVKDIFKFEQPKQWAMPLTQMQMLNARYVMRYEVWSEKWQTVRSHPWFDFFYNFYGTTYTLPTLYSWYLVTDDRQARVKAEKVVDWLLSVQEKSGTWFSQYCVEGNPPQLVGRDQAWNRWVMPHSTATAAKTLLWYWEASGKSDGRVFDAAKRGCDWLIATQRPDGGWPYAFDLDGKPVTDLPDAGQIWCTWALWKMHEYTGEAKYKEAAVRSRDFFRKTFMDLHRYMGYWEDVSGMAGKVARSWEGYEPAIAALVFADMGDKQLAIEAAKDAATWSWTRVISTRQYETCYGETTEQSVCGPSQAQSPMTGLGMQQIYELTGDKLWSDFAGATKAVNFCADPDQAYGMVATGGWDDPLTGVVGPPYDNVRPWVTPDNSRGDEYGRQVWNEWCTAQFAWLALEWLVRESNIRAPEYVKIDPDTYRGTVLGEPGRVKMPEEKCDVNGIEHHDINWVGYQNDSKYVLLVMNHKSKLTVMVRPHEAHLDVYCRAPRILTGSGRSYKAAKPGKKGEQYVVEIPANGTALMVWDRIK